MFVTGYTPYIKNVLPLTGEKIWGMADGWEWC